MGPGQRKSPLWSQFPRRRLGNSVRLSSSFVIAFVTETVFRSREGEPVLGGVSAREEIPSPQPSPPKGIVDLMIDSTPADGTTRDNAQVIFLFETRHCRS